MCQSKDTEICTGDCNNCTGTTLHAPDAHKRFKKLSHAVSEKEQETAQQNICSLQQ